MPHLQTRRSTANDNSFHIQTPLFQLVASSLTRLKMFLRARDELISIVELQEVSLERFIPWISENVTIWYFLQSNRHPGVRAFLFAKGHKHLADIDAICNLTEKSIRENAICPTDLLPSVLFTEDIVGAALEGQKSLLEGLL